MGLAGGAHQPLAGQLGLAVGAQRRARGVLGDQVHVGHAVDGGGGGEEEVADARGRHGLEQHRQALHVLVVVVQRLLDGLADLLLAREVHHTGDLVLTDGLVEDQPVQDRADHQRYALRDTVLVARGEVVDDDHVLPREQHRPDDVCADVSGATGDQKRHVYLLGPVRVRCAALVVKEAAFSPPRGLPWPGGGGCVRGTARPRRRARGAARARRPPCGRAAPAEHRTGCWAGPGGGAAGPGGAGR